MMGCDGDSLAYQITRGHGDPGVHRDCRYRQWGADRHGEVGRYRCVQMGRWSARGHRGVNGHRGMQQSIRGHEGT